MVDDYVFLSDNLIMFDSCTYLILTFGRCFQDDQEYAVRYQWRGFGSDCEPEMDARVPGAPANGVPRTDQIVPRAMDEVDCKFTVPQA